MKTIKLFSTLVLTVVLSSSFLSSCSHDQKSTEIEMANGTKVDRYLKSFYNRDFQLGNSIEKRTQKTSSGTDRSVEVESVIVTEVFVGDDVRARGYAFANKYDGSLLFFIDVDRVDLKMYFEDLQVNESQHFESIDHLDKYTSTNQFDWLKIAEEYNGSETFGIRPVYSYGAPFTGVDGLCHQGVYVQTRFLGINWTGISPVLNENGSHATVLCGQTYQP